MTPAQMAAEVLRLSEAARPAPWSIPATIPGKYRYVDAPDEDLVCGPLYTADAEFIAYTRTAAPAIAQALLDALERLAAVEAKLATLRGVVREMLEDAAPFPHQLSYQVFDKARKLVTAAEEDADA